MRIAHSLFDSVAAIRGPIVGTSSGGGSFEFEDTVLTWIFVVLEIVLMSTLVIIASAFLCQSCRSKQKTASFIIKLLILVLLVAVTGIFNAFHSAPWWRNKSGYFGSMPDIIVICVSEFIYWVSAQWSTWIIAFQFYSTAQ
jgi:hypothetical protein